MVAYAPAHSLRGLYAPAPIITGLNSSIRRRAFLTLSAAQLAAGGRDG